MYSTDIWIILERWNVGNTFKSNRKHVILRSPASSCPVSGAQLTCNKFKSMSKLKFNSRKSILCLSGRLICSPTHLTNLPRAINSKAQRLHYFPLAQGLLLFVGRTQGWGHQGKGNRTLSHAPVRDLIGNKRPPQPRRRRHVCAKFRTS